MQRVILPVLSIQADEKHCGDGEWDCAWRADRFPEGHCGLFDKDRAWDGEAFRWVRLPACVDAETRKTNEQK